MNVVKLKWPAVIITFFSGLLFLFRMTKVCPQNSAAKYLDLNLLFATYGKVDRINVTAGYIKVSCDAAQLWKVYFLTAEPTKPEESKGSILLLNGMTNDGNGTADLWQSIDSLRIFAAAGYHVYAPDLPGTEKSRSTTTLKSELKMNKLRFIREMILEFGLTKVIIIAAPSAATLSLPLLTKYQRTIIGFIAISPDISKDFIDKEKDYTETEVPTLIIYGTEDRDLYVGSFDKVKNSEIVTIHGAGANLIAEKRHNFHAVSLNFIESISDTEMVVEQFERCIRHCQEPCNRLKVVFWSSTTQFPNMNTALPFVHLLERMHYDKNENLKFVGERKLAAAMIDNSNQVVPVSLFYESTNVRVITKVERCNFETLLSNVGGALGLWAGMSLVTVLQAFMYLIMAIMMTQKENIKENTTAMVGNLRLQ